MGKTSSAAKYRYNKKAYDSISVRVPKGKRAEIHAYAEARGESVNGLICRLLDAEMKREQGENICD